jgi:murein DD-endopeptidase MepM/ murein hydrolase activator NlpD
MRWRAQTRIAQTPMAPTPIAQTPMVPTRSTRRIATLAVVLTAMVGVGGFGGVDRVARAQTDTTPPSAPVSTEAPTAAPTTLPVETTTSTAVPLPTPVPALVTVPVAIPVSTVAAGPTLAGSTAVPTSTVAPGPTLGGPSTTIDPLLVDATGESTTTVDPSLTSTSSSTSTSTTVDPALTTTSTEVPIIDPLDDATPEDPPSPGFIPSLPAPNFAPVRNITAEQALLKLTAEQRKAVAEAQAQADAAQVRVASAQGEIESIQDRQDELRVLQGELEAKRERSAGVIRSRALSVYAGSDVSEIDLILRSADTSEFSRRIELVNQAQKNDVAALALYEADRQALLDAAKELDELSAEKNAELESLVADQIALNEALSRVQEQLQATLSGYAIALNGWVFPVQPPVSFVDTFGADRMNGTKFFHAHQGTDIFAPHGTPIRAVSRGVIARKGVAVLGGNKLWLIGHDGTQYYYAHLSAFVEGVDDGTVVEAGQVIGFVGDTGNARGTPAHLHFEIHPGGGRAVNPFPTLDAVRRSDITALLEAQKLGYQTLDAVTKPSATPADAKTVRAGLGVTREFAIGPVDASAAGPTTTSIPGATTIVLPVRKDPNSG